MTAVLDLFLGAGMAAVTGIAGYLAGRPRSRADRMEMPKPICPCAHPISFHADLTGACAGADNVPAKWNQFGNPVAWKKEPCPCGHYAGPELISQVSMRALTTEQD